MRIATTTPRLLATALIGALLLAGCDDGDEPGEPMPVPAPSPAPAPTMKPLGYTWTLTDDQAQHTETPDTYTVTYLAGSLKLRQNPRVLLGFRVDSAHPDQNSELLKSNTDTAARNGWATTPATVDGGIGITFLEPDDKQVNTVRTVVAKGPVTVTVNVASEQPGDDSAARTLHDELLRGLRFRGSGLSGPYPGTVAEPQLPFDVQVPAVLGGPFETQYVVYAVELAYGTYKTVVSATWQEPAAAAAAFETTRNELRKSGVRHQNDVKTLPALKDTLGPIVDEGFTFSLVGEDQVARYVGVLFRQGGVTVRTFTNVGELPLAKFSADSNAALAAPMGVARSWRWTTN